MIITTKRMVLKCLFLLPLMALALFVSGCAGPKIANDLLAHAEKNSKPLVNNTVIVDAEVNSSINNYELLDETVEESLEIALINANIFGSDSSRPYRINANIMVASQSPMSFGSFKGKLKINYTLFDEADNKIIDEIIYTEAGSDKMYLSGVKRHRRSRAVNISTNVLQFVDILQNKLVR